MVTGGMTWEPTTTPTTTTPDYSSAASAVSDFTSAVDHGTGAVNTSVGPILLSRICRHD